MKEAKKQKSGKMKKQELKAKKEAAFKAAIAQKQVAPPVVYVMTKKTRNLPAAVEAVFAGSDLKGYEHKVQNIVQAARNHINPTFLKEIFLHFANCKVDFTQVTTAPIDALANLARYQTHAIRAVKDWEPSSYNLKRNVSDFARHLYAKYHIPLFMDEAWYGANDREQGWFIHIGQGQNIRTAMGLPLPLTKKEAHLMMQAPKDFKIKEAIRYGQILNMGGNEPFVRTLFKTRVAVDFNQNEFWTSVFRWLLANPMLDTAHYATIIDFLYHQRFVPDRVDGQGQMVCAQPNLSMKNRDPEATLRQVKTWHRQVNRERRVVHYNSYKPVDKWATSGIKPYYHQNDEDKCIYRISEILTYNDLLSEGRTMKHCVGSYSHSCATGRISIWKFEVVNKQGTDKRLTVEVENGTKTIRQARGKCNVLANASDRFWLNNWCRVANLKISNYLI
jgi:hypothetical protein